MSRRAFARFHPAVILAFVASVVIFAMVVRVPTFAVAGLVLSSVAYVGVRGRDGIKVVLAAIALTLVVAIFNAFFNAMGSTILFLYMDGRPFTLEALLSGAVTGAMFATATLWFGFLNRSVTTDGLMVAFERIAPALAMTLTLTMRFVPRYARKASAISQARAGIGRDPREGTLKERISCSAGVLSALVTWALEGSIVTADSMRSRGYGCARRTSYTRRYLRASDTLLLAFVLLLDACLAVCLSLGAGDVQYFPRFVCASVTPAFACGLASYMLLMAIPILIEIAEGVMWHVLLSRV